MAKIQSIQTLRAGAALAVTFGHLEHEAASLPSANGFEPLLLDLTGAGVDLFFVISGFVMVYASRDLFQRRDAVTLFLSRRVFRIVPLYWLISTLFLIMLSTTHTMSSPIPTAVEVIKSYAFIPYVPHEGGAVQPIYKLGWTLNDEMFFYVVFAAALAFPMRQAVILVAAVFAGLVGLGIAINPPPGIVATWTNPIILDFTFGTFVALLYQSGVRLRVGSASVMILSGFAGFGVTSALALDAHGAFRPLVWGVPATLIFIGAVLLPSRVPAAGKAPLGLVSLGDASYAIYLLHPIVIRCLRVCLDKTHMSAEISPWIFIVTGMIMVIPAALAAHRWIERPAIRCLYRRFGTDQSDSIHLVPTSGAKRRVVGA